MNDALSRKITFTLIFAALGFLALQIPVARLAGSKATFTLFDCFAPIAGAFIGTLPGILAVFLMQLFNFALHGFQSPDIGTMIRFFPPLFACLYFAKKRKINIIVPIVAIVAFNLHPIGRSVWYYSLFWLIPIASTFFYEQSLLARSLGATFTAHAVGGVLWIYAFALPARVWISLIPVVAIERAMFGLGIAITYVGANTLLDVLIQKNLLSKKLEIMINQRYVWHFR